MTGISLERLSKIRLTAQDVDPIGGLPKFLTRVKRPFAVLVHELQKSYIEGDKPLI